MAPVKKIRVQLKPPAPKPRRNVTGTGPRKSSPGGPLASFVCALDDPFCTESFGAKVPDEYTLPTEAVTLRHRYSVANALSGDYVVVTPHPAIGSIGIPGSSSGAPTMLAITGSDGTVQVNSVASNLLTVPMCSPCKGANLVPVYSSYRVVGWGVRLKNITKATDVQGDVTAGILPIGGAIPNSLLNYAGTFPTVTTNPGGLWQELTRFASLPTSTYATASGNYSAPLVSGLDQLASFDNFTNAELAETGGIMLKPKIHSPGSAWKFRPTSLSVSGGGVQNGQGWVPLSATQGSGTVASGGSIDPLAMDCSGHNCVVIQFGPSTGQTYEIEVVYHLEVIPVITSQNLTPVGNRPSPIVSRSVIDNLLVKILQSPWVEFVKHEGSRAMSNMTQALPGLMTKGAMMALGM